MALLEIHRFMCRSDNYGVLIHDKDTGATATIDAPEEAPILKALDEKGWQLSHIFTTHHHYDHVEGNEALKAKFDCQIIGPNKEKDKIPALEKGVEGFDRFQFGNHDVEVIDCPGHTLGQVSYYLPQAGVVFTGDTLFAMGCGRIFEGTPEDMWRSLQRLKRLPEETEIYFGHEYTLSNAKFALSIDPENKILKERVMGLEKSLAKGEFSCPTNLKLELETNPFLRPSDRKIKKHLNMENASDLEVFTEIRSRKDNV